MSMTRMRISTPRSLSRSRTTGGWSDGTGKRMEPRRCERVTALGMQARNAGLERNAAASTWSASKRTWI